jgi:hypothetical protein
VPPAPALVAEVETYEADATPAAARRGPSTQPAGRGTARGNGAPSDRPVRRPLMGNAGDMRDLDAYLYASTGRAPDDPYRLTDPMLYAVPWGHPAPPPYPPPPLPSRGGGYGYGGGYYAPWEPRLIPFEIPPGGTVAPGPVRVIRQNTLPPGRAARAARGNPPVFISRPPLPPGTNVPRARTPVLRPGT